MNNFKQVFSALFLLFYFAINLNTLHAQCGAGQTFFSHCYDNDESNFIAFEICPSSGMSSKATILSGSFYDGDDLTVYEGASGSAISGTIYLGPISGDVSGEVITGATPDACLIFVINSDNIIGCDDGLELELEVCGESIAPGTVQLTVAADFCVTAGVQNGLVGGLPAGGVYSGPGVSDDGNGMTYSFDPVAAGVGLHIISYTSGGNSDSDQIEVTAVPTVGFSAPIDLCIDAGIQTGLGGGTPTGGVYTGPGVTDDGNGMTYTFNPGIAGLGIHTLSYTEASPCAITSTDDIEVLAACGCPVGQTSYFHCYDNDEANLVIFEVCPSAGMAAQATIEEGFYTNYFDQLTVYQGISGSGTTGDIVFGPQNGDLTGVVITGNLANNCLIFVNSTDPILSCMDGDAIGLSVCGESIPTSIVFTALTDICIDAGVQSGVGGGSPTGGVFSGPGVTDDGNGMTYSFDPVAATVGLHTITYTIGMNSESDDVEVLAIPSVNFTALSDLCIDAGTQNNLGGATPTGGVYSGPGVTDDGNGLTYSFNPAIAGLGTHTITYTEGSACLATAVDNVEVLAACTCPVGEASYFNCYGNEETNLVIFEVCPSAGMFAQADIAQGTYFSGDLLTVYQGSTGSGIGGTIVYGPVNGNLMGTTIIGTVADECLIFVSNSDFVISCQDGFEIPLLVCGSSNATNVTFTALDDLSINSGVQTGLSQGLPTGGVYSGPGVTDNGNGMTYTFDPVFAGIGVHTLTYTVGGGSATDEVEVLNLLPPGFSKSFNPSIIASGAVTTLTFTINNSGSDTPLTNLDFTDNLPAGMTIANPTNLTTTCFAGTVTAIPGTSTISFANGSLSGFGSCTISVNITSTASGTNTTGDLTSSAGNSGTASANLTVANDRPTLSKSFNPSSINLGERSTLTLTIDNSMNTGNNLLGITLTDHLPDGMVIASPANASSTNTGIGTFTADSGTSLISYNTTGFTEEIAAGGTCTFTVDVVGTTIGNLDNVTEDLSVRNSSFQILTCGKASASLTVVDPGEILLQKRFTTNPVSPGGTTNLEFTLTNLDRDFEATNVSFTDDLSTVLPGLAATGTPLSNICGTGSTLSGTTLLTFTGGTIPAGGTCTFSLPISVPGGAVPGTYLNTTGAITAIVNGSSVTGNQANASLFVADVPTFSKTFISDPIPAGGTTTVEFTITNTSTTDALTDITFVDNISDFMSGVIVSTLPPANSCGTGSTFFTSVVGGDFIFQMTGGNIAAGASCTFAMDLTTPVGTPGGTYTNATGTLMGFINGLSVSGEPATDDLTVLSVPTLSKSFLNDPVNAGDIVNLEFTITHDASASGDATSIAFTDDLNAVIPGLVAIGLPLNDICGTGASISGTTNLTFSGGILSPGGTCTFSVPVQVPAGISPGSYVNTTSALSATVGGQSATGNVATADLEIGGFSLTKEFIDDPVIPGELTTLRFTFDNTTTFDATNIVFTDNLNSVLPGLATEGTLPTGTAACNAPTVSGTTFFIFAGGSVTAGTSCSFDIPVRVPLSATSWTYTNMTSNITADINGASMVLDPAVDDLMVNKNLISLTKSFTDDPVLPGNTVTVEYTITNLDATNTLSNIAFTDDFDGMLTGLAAIGLPINDGCGVGSQVSGTGLVSFAGGNLAGGSSCTFSVTLQTPVAAPYGGVYTSTTSTLTGEINSLGVTGDAASDDLVFEALSFSKSFLGAVRPGEEATLRYLITNENLSSQITDISFTDNLDAVILGMAATNLPIDDVCGTGSRLSGTSVITLGRGVLSPSESSTFDVTVLVPCGTAGDTYNSASDNITGLGITGGNAAADLVVDPAPNASFTTSAVFPLNSGVQTGLNGGTPIQGAEVSDLGVYSGPGVTDDGNGMTFTFDPAAAGLGMHTVTYTYTDGNGCITTASDDIEVSAALPIELISFNAKPMESSVDLFWSTASEINNEGFDLQRSIHPSLGFSSIGWINGRGNTSQLNSYSYSDRDIEKSIVYYYRLRQLDFDGKESFSPVVSAQVKGLAWSMSILPNPAVDETEIVVNKKVTKEVLTIRLIGIDGKVWMEHSLKEEEDRLKISLEEIPSGIYLVQLTGDDLLLLERMVKN